jgi:CubicO group peptidase (beta-lactamase class C family)
VIRFFSVPVAAVVAGVLGVLAAGVPCATSSSASTPSCSTAAPTCASAPSCATAPACATSAPSCATSSPSCASSCVTGQAGAAESLAVDPAAALVEALPSEAIPGIRNINAILAPIRERNRVPALAAALVKNSKTIAAGALGVRVAGTADPVTLDDRFHLGSSTKSMTATVAAALVHEGKIAWDTRLVDIYPDLAANAHPGYNNVTLHQLLSHRSGFPAAEMNPELRKLGGPVTRDRRALVDLAVALDPVGMPGSTFLYSDVGYNVAGAMLEQVSGLSWEDLVRKHVAGPLGMTTLGFGQPEGEGSPAQPRGHVKEGKALRPMMSGSTEDEPPAIGPAGLVHTSVLDWARFASLHLRVARGEESGWPAAATLKSLFADTYNQGYGLGWVILEQPWSGGRMLAHSGSCGEWSSLIWIAPGQDVALVAMSNYGGMNGHRACLEALEAMVAEFVRAAN